MFEAWLTKDGDYEPELLDGPKTSAGFLYTNADTENMWNAWQARAAVSHDLKYQELLYAVARKFPARHVIKQRCATSSKQKPPLTNLWTVRRSVDSK